MPPRPTPCRHVLLLALLLAPLAAAQAPDPALAPAEPLAAGPSDTAALRDPSLYAGEVELVSQGAGERRAAAARALAQVVVKLTGNPQAAANPVVRRALSQAEAYVVGARGAEGGADQEGNAAVGGVPVYRTRMVFEFDPGRVDALVAGAGLPVWGADRVAPLLWLAIDDGRGARLVNARQVNVVKPLASRGLERGLRFALPAGSAVEQAAVQTVWSRSPGPLAPLAARYGIGTQLLGRLYRAGSGWTADWVLVRGEAELSRWSFSDPSPQRALASGADGAADAIARRDAVAVPVGEPVVQLASLVGLAGEADYVRAIGYLQTLPVVREVRVLEATPEGVSLRLDLAVGAEAFAAFIAVGDALEADPAAAPDAPRLRLRTGR